MKSEELAEMFVNGHVHKKKLGSVSFDGPTYYSYGHAIGYRLEDSLYLVRRDNYSRSTKHHVRQLIGAIPNNMLIICDEWDGYKPDLYEIERALAKREAEMEEKLSAAIKITDIREYEEELEIAARSLRNLTSYAIV